AGVAVRAPRAIHMTIADHGEVHARDGIDDLVRDATRHEPGADHRDLHGIADRSPALQRSVDDDHAERTCAVGGETLSRESRSGQSTSFLEITVTGSGQGIPIAGSS